MPRASLVLLALCLTACGGEPGERTGQGPPARAVKEVWTTFYPTTYLVERVAGGVVKVVCPLPEGEDPASWEPDAKTLQGYQAADLIVVNGADFEAWVGRASLPVSRVVKTAQGFSESWIRIQHATKHSHGGGAAHAHEGVNGHTWLDPLLAKAQADAIRKALVRLLPEKAAQLDANFAALATDLDALDAGFRALGGLPAGQTLYAAHPAWTYLGARYGWPLEESLVLAPEEPLTERQAAQLKELLAVKPGAFILWEDDPLPATAERLEKELGLRSLTVPPCESETAADKAAGRDFLVRMRANLEALRPAFAR